MSQRIIYEEKREEIIDVFCELFDLRKEQVVASHAGIETRSLTALMWNDSEVIRLSVMTDKVFKTHLECTDIEFMKIINSAYDQLNRLKAGYNAEVERMRNICADSGVNLLKGIDQPQFVPDGWVDRNKR